MHNVSLNRARKQVLLQAQKLHAYAFTKVARLVPSRSSEPTPKTLPFSSSPDDCLGGRRGRAVISAARPALFSQGGYLYNLISTALYLQPYF